MRRRAAKNSSMERTTSATSVAELADASDASDALAFRRALKRRSERTLRRKEQLKERPATPNQPQRRKRNQLLLSFAEMPLGYQCECTKARGFRCGYTAREAALSMFDPNQNEFYNMVTDAAPLWLRAVPAVLGRYCLSWAPFLRAPPPPRGLSGDGDGDGAAARGVPGGAHLQLLLTAPLPRHLVP